MTRYLIRIIKYRWDALSKAVKHKPICSKSVFLTEEPTLNQLKTVLNLLTTKLSTNPEAGNSPDKEEMKLD